MDAANVIGSRPDGWWRDRPGAARRLLDALKRAADTDEELVVVLEGASRAAAETGMVDGVRVVHAPRSGDDEIVRLVEEAMRADPQRHVTVITADRGLRERVTALGAETAGPRSLWNRLEQ